jgi:hypothetical protein
LSFDQTQGLLFRSPCLELFLSRSPASLLLSYVPSQPFWLKYNGPIVSRATPAMIVDGFPYSHEYLLLDLRLRMLAPVVDYHIMVEAAFDQLGRKRRLYAGSDAVSAEVLREFADKMVRVELQEPPKEVPFYRRKSMLGC